jgi:hypothetical protein
MRREVSLLYLVQYLIVALNLSLSYYRARKVSEAIDSLKPLLEYMVPELKNFPVKLETENNPFFQHLALRIDMSAEEKDFPIRFHMELDVR